MLYQLPRRNVILSVALLSFVLEKRLFQSDNSIITAWGQIVREAAKLSFCQKASSKGRKAGRAVSAEAKRPVPFGIIFIQNNAEKLAAFHRNKNSRRLVFQFCRPSRPAAIKMSFFIAQQSKFVFETQRLFPALFCGNPLLKGRNHLAARRLHAAAALLQNDPQEGLRRLMELFGGPVHAPFARLSCGATPRTRTRPPPILLSVCGATRPACPRARLCRGYGAYGRSCAIDRYRALTRRGVLFPLDGREEDMDFAVELKPPGNAGACRG